MTKQRMLYVYHLVGVINKQTKSAPREGKYSGIYYWNLAVQIDNKPVIKFIKCFPDKLENQTIWKAIEKKKSLGKRYTFHCRNWKGHYYLINWEKLSNSSINKADHGSN